MADVGAGGGDVIEAMLGESIVDAIISLLVVYAIGVYAAPSENDLDDRERARGGEPTSDDWPSAKVRQ